MNLIILLIFCCKFFGLIFGENYLRNPNDNLNRITPNPITTSTTTIMSLECRQQQSNCTENVLPYLNDSKYMFPTSLDNVNDMCKMWSRFVDCIRRYISQCFEENRRQLFHKSVENSIDTVHAICSSKLYQTEYLKKANCFKQVSMDHCGTNYQLLIDNIANPFAKDEHICCSYAQFKQCVNKPLLDECGRKAKNLMDHSMSFLISRCDHYNYQRQTECPQPIPIAKSIDEKPKTSFRINMDQQDHHLNHPHNPHQSNKILDSDSKIVPVYSESREWPVNPPAALDLSASSSSSSSSNSIGAGVDVMDPDEPDEPIADESKQNPINPSDPDMIVYTMKPETHIASMLLASASSSQQSGASASIFFINHLNLFFIIILASIFLF